MEFSLVKYVELLMLPPGIVVLLGVAGLLLYRIRARWGMALMGFAVGLLYLLSMPLFSGAVMRGLETYPALPAGELHAMGADAIVILAGGRLRQQPEYDGDTVTDNTLMRVRYGAWLKRRTQLPLYVSGGSVEKEEKPEAELMREVLQKEFNVEVNVVEDKSKTTYENAKYTAELLKRNHHQKVFLVSNSAHLPRAVEAFQKFGIDVIPAPTVFTTNSGGFSLLDVLPQSYAFRNSYLALHELIGRLWYHLRYY